MKISLYAAVSAALIGSLITSPAFAQRSKRFPTELAAQNYCQTNTVVWVNRNTKVFHSNRSARYGRSKRGAYMCESDAISAGYHAVKVERATAF